MPYKLKPLNWEGKLDLTAINGSLEAQTVDFLTLTIEFKYDDFWVYDTTKLVVTLNQNETMYWEVKSEVEPFDTLEEGIEKAKALAEKLWYEYLVKNDYIEPIN